MNDKTIIYEKENIKIIYKKGFHEIDVDLLKKTIYGTNGPQYQHTGQELKLRDLINPHYFNLIFDETVIGFYCIVKRDITTIKNNYLGFYGRYFAIDKIYQNLKLGQLLKTEAIKYLSSKLNEPSIFYSYVEENNLPSIKISENDGFQYYSHLNSLIFSRIYPKMHKSFYQLKPDELPIIKNLLQIQNRNLTFQTLENIGYQNNYFVLKINDEIVVGLQANPVSWIIKKLNGFSGFFILNILPFIPILNRLFNPKKYSFLAIEGFYIKVGFENMLYPLLESTLNHFSETSALFQIDFKDPILNIFEKYKKLGILNKIRKKTNTHLVIKPIGFDYLNSDLPNGTTYVSSFDFT